MRTVFVGAQEKPGGVNSYTYNLAIELKRRGYESSVLSFGACNKVHQYKGVKIRQYKTLGGTMTGIPMLYMKSLPYLIRNRKNIDVIMYQTVIFSIIPSLVVRLFGIRTCAIIHSLAEDSPKHGPFMKLILKTAMKLALSLANNVITVSDSKAREVYDRYKVRCKVLPCGVFLPTDRDDDNNLGLLTELGIIGGKYFLTVGRIDPIKNYEALIDAFMQHDHSGYQLVICGDTNNPYAKTIVNRALLCKNIIFPGVVTGTLKSILLKNCMAYCLVSSSEGLPIALLEGMSYGKIPIVTRIPSIQGVLENYGIGLWCEVNNVDHIKSNMVKVECNYEQYRHYGEIAYKIVKDNYTWPMICDRYLELVKEL